MTLERLLMEARFATLIALYGKHVLSLGNVIFGPKCLFFRMVWTPRPFAFSFTQENIKKKKKQKQKQKQKSRRRRLVVLAYGLTISI